MLTRIVFVVFLLLTGATAWLTWYGIGAETSGVVKSVRTGSIGNASGFIGK